MPDAVPIPRTLETPPRTTGDPQLDLPLLVDWFWRAYQVITQSVDYINGQSVGADSNISLLNNDSGFIGLDYYALEDALIKFKGIIRGQEPSGASDLTTKNYVDTTFSASAHGPVTVTDSSEIDFTLSVQNITASIKPGSISSGRLETAVTTSLGLADTSIQPGDRSSNLIQDMKVRTISSGTGTLTNADKFVSVTYTSTGAVTITLPSAASCWDAGDSTGIPIFISDTGANSAANNITVNRAGSDTIVDSATGQTSTVLAANGSGWWFIPINSTTWKVF